MKFFYVMAVLAVALLALSPYYLLPKPEPLGGIDDVIAYETLPAKVKAIDAATAGDNISNMVLGGPYESLLAYHYLVRPSLLIPCLAEEFPTESPDRLTYTFKLRRDARYHRNPCFGYNENTKDFHTRVIKADDFVLAFKRIADFHITTTLSLAFVEDKIVGLKAYRDKTRQYAKGDFSRYDLPVEGLKALDDHTLQIKLVQPWPQLLYVLALNCYAPIPRELIDYHLSTRSVGKDANKRDIRKLIPLRERDPEIRTEEAVIGTGAYYMDKFSDSEILMRRNPDYRGTTYPAPPDPATLSPAQQESVKADIAAGLYASAGRPCPAIDVIQFRIVEEMNPMWGLFLSKQVDTAGIPQELYHQVITPGRELTDKWARQGIRLIKYADPTIYWIAFNMEDKVVGKSKSLRQALQMSYDIEKYIEVIWGGRGIRARAYVPSDFEGYMEAPSPYARFDLEAAKAKLEDAKKELIAAGVIKEGDPIPPVTIEIGGLEETERRISEFTQQQFRQIGVDLKISMNDWPTLQKKVHNKEFQIYSMGWGADYPDPENFLQLFYSPNIKRGTNNTNYSRPEFDRLYEQVAVMSPSPQRTELYVKMLNMLNEDSPTLLMYEPIRMALMHSWVKDVKPHPIAYGMGKYRRIDVEERRKAGGR